MATPLTPLVGVLARFQSEFVSPEQPHVLPEYDEAAAVALAIQPSPPQRPYSTRLDFSAAKYVDDEAEEVNSDSDSASNSSESFIHEGSEDDFICEED